MWSRSARFCAFPDSTDQSVILRTYSDRSWRHDWFESCVRSSWDLNGIQEKQGGGGACGLIYFWEGGSKKDPLRHFSHSWRGNQHWNWYNWIINTRAASGGWTSLQHKRNVITSHDCPLNVHKYEYYNWSTETQRNIRDWVKETYTYACVSERITVTTASITSKAPWHHWGRSLALIDADGNIFSCNFLSKGSDLAEKPGPAEERVLWQIVQVLELIPTPRPLYGRWLCGCCNSETFWEKAMQENQKLNWGGYREENIFRVPLKERAATNLCFCWWETHKLKRASIK